MTLPVLIDCDTGIDDAIALTYLACRSDVEIAGIVSTGGNVPVAAVHRNNLSLSELLGLDAPVALGESTPLVQEPMYADDTHGPQGIGHAVLPDPARAEDARSGARLWVDMARAHPGELVGLVLGPHTNLALALEIDPELPRLLKRLHIMGGAINHRGNTGATSEWNIAVDPEAAQRVLAAFSTAPGSGPCSVPSRPPRPVRFTEDTLDRYHGGSRSAPAILSRGSSWTPCACISSSTGPTASAGWRMCMTPWSTAHAVTGALRGHPAAWPSTSSWQAR